MLDQTAQSPIAIGNQQSAISFDAKKFVEELKKRGRTDQEIAQLIAGTIKLSAMDLYVAMMTHLSDADLAELDKLPDEEAMMKRAEEIFVQKTGMNLEELADSLQQTMLQAAIDVNAEDETPVESSSG